MPAYAVRLIESHDIVGVYFCEDDESLAALVDETTDTRSCEYRELPEGGVRWDGPAFPVPTPPATTSQDDSDDADAAQEARFLNIMSKMSGAGFTSDLFFDLIDEEGIWCGVPLPPGFTPGDAELLDGPAPKA